MFATNLKIKGPCTSVSSAELGLPSAVFASVMNAPYSRSTARLKLLSVLQHVNIFNKQMLLKKKKPAAVFRACLEVRVCEAAVKEAAWHSFC